MFRPGPVARAFASRSPAVLNRIPPWRSDPLGAIAAWSEQGLTEDEVRGFSRHASCVLAVPLVLFKDRCTGVLCVDLMTTPQIDDGELLEFALWIAEANGTFIASLLEQRMA
jgi:hypothetical protein